MMTRATLALALAALIAAPPLYAAPKEVPSATNIPIVGTAAEGTFNGIFSLQRFATDADGKLVAVGTVSGSITDAAGKVVKTGLSTVALPVKTNQQAVTTAALPAQATAACQILHLDLGPLDLNLLGLQVHLNEVVLDITAVPGAGNLLGNLLCSVANLLNNPSGLAQLLNQILSILQGL